MKKISVIMGIFNCSQTLSDAIESIISQTYSNWELIMCDDASTDDTYTIAKRYAERYPDRIILIANDTNQRLAKSLNNCLRYATGEYIARMDGDDISVSTRFEEQMNFLEEHPEYDLVGTQMISFDETGDKGIRECQREPQKQDLVYGNPFCHATIMAKRIVYDKLQGYSEKKYISRCEDVELWFRFYEAGFRGYNIDRPLYKVRETLGDFKRRKLCYTVDTMRVCFEGYKKLHYPLKRYIFLLKPLISDLVPRRLMKYYNNKKDGKNI